ncbi:MAG: flagellar assembly protein FliH [Sphingomonas sp.]|uniref:FliH/SctL family protein n=1 Tax=Sphingomonas sp. TaxID=28214 RepID=UPI0025EF09BF|nr:FliH/SctL family protein [Sphingomonas sp.]MBY0282573.1 flagellar assembly protein FliH [Sphingomonas sp.]
MSDLPGFAAGFVSRHDPAARAHLALVASDPFAPADLKARANHGRRKSDRPAGPQSFAPQPVGPRSFAPEDHDEDGADTAQENFADPIAAARAQAFAEGMAHARALDDAAGERDVTLFATLAAALKSSERIDRDALARQLRETVMFLVTKMIGEVGVSGDVLAARIDAATVLLADAAESALLRVHPDDIDLLKDRLPTTIFPVGDESVSRGSFVLEAASTIVEEGPELWLEQLAAAIERVALPPLC